MGRRGFFCLKHSKKADIIEIFLLCLLRPNNQNVADVVFYSMLAAGYLFIVFTQMLVVILENRQPVKTVAWLMVLFFLPVFGLIIYFFFGRNRKREHFVSRAN